MLAPESISGLFELGFADSAFHTPDPENNELVSRKDRPSRKALTFRTQSYLLTKRTLDFGAALAVLLLLSPILLTVALLVRLTSRGPVIFSQERLTEGGKIFRMYKFRTMRVDAESGTGPVWAQERDPRVTSVGRFLRLSHLDELPQLINVLTGDMSIVGPRPERPELAAQIEAELPTFRRRLEVKGGITGLAQVSSGYAANMQTYKKKLSYDIQYVKQRSLLLDLAIIAKTVVVVFTGAGAR